MSLAGPPDLARIPAGEFLMGSADADFDERPVHRVHISDFSIGTRAVTHDEYNEFVRASGYPAPEIRDLPLIARGGLDATFRELASAYAWDRGAPPPGRSGHPVVLIRYEDALAYCRWLSAQIGKLVRLPTEAEWERAARGGIDGHRYPWGDEISAANGNYLADRSMKHQHGTQPAGTFAPNGFGVYDMAGNVWEWVSDWYAHDYYAISEPRDPRGPSHGTMRIVRGGSWVNDDVMMLRCGYRHKVPPDTYAYSIGFRIVCID
jgi:formylglycine-generating enzyme required for sulfatase activity